MLTLHRLGAGCVRRSARRAGDLVHRRGRQPLPLQHVPFRSPSMPPAIRAGWTNSRIICVRTRGIVLSRTQRRDLFIAEPIPVLAVQVLQAAYLPELFQKTERDLPRHHLLRRGYPHRAAGQSVFGIFPLAYCLIEATDDFIIQSVKVLRLRSGILTRSTRRMRILSLEPDVNPSHACRASCRCATRSTPDSLSLLPERPFPHQHGLHSADLRPGHAADQLGRYLAARASADAVAQVEGPAADSTVNRVAACCAKGERVYFSYGQVIHRGNQIHTVRAAAHRPHQCHAVGGLRSGRRV